MQTLTDALERASQLLDLTLDAGATDADVFLQMGTTTHITWQHEHLAQSSGAVCGLAVRAWRGEKVALLTTTNLVSTHLAALARLVVQEAEQGIALPPYLRASTDEMPTISADLTEESHNTGEMATAFEELVLAVQANIETFQGMLHASLTRSKLTTILLNSRQFQSAYTAHNYRLWTWIEGLASHQTMAIASRNFGDLIPGMLAQQVHVNPAFLAGETQRAPAGYCQAVFSPLAGADIARALGTLFTADRIMGDLKSLFKYVGHRIASPTVTLIDDSMHPVGVKSRPFDDEGTPSQTTTLLERGILKAFLHTQHTAAVLGLPANGKATRAELWKQPQPRMSTIYLQAGQEAPEDLLRQIQRGILVTNVLRPGRIQGRKGKFMTVVQGWWVENGTRMYPVSGVSLTSPIFDLLRNVRACGSDLQFSSLSDGAGSPSILFDKILVE